VADAPRRTEQRRILRVFELEPAEPVTDTVVREVPLRIVINDREFAVVSMLPGEERELTCGLLLTSGIVKSADDVLDWRHDDKCNTVNIELNVNSSKLDEAVQARARWPASGQPPEFPSAVALAPVKSGMLVKS